MSVYSCKRRWYMQRYCTGIYIYLVWRTVYMLSVHQALQWMLKDQYADRLRSTFYIPLDTKQGHFGDVTNTRLTDCSSNHVLVDFIPCGNHFVLEADSHLWRSISTLLIKVKDYGFSKNYEIKCTTQWYSLFDFTLNFLLFVSEYLILFLRTCSLDVHHFWYWIAYNVLMCHQETAHSLTHVWEIQWTLCENRRTPPTRSLMSTLQSKMYA